MIGTEYQRQMGQAVAAAPIPTGYVATNLVLKYEVRGHVVSIDPATGRVHCNCEKFRGSRLSRPSVWDAAPLGGRGLADTCYHVWLIAPFAAVDLKEMTK